MFLHVEGIRAAAVIIALNYLADFLLDRAIIDAGTCKGDHRQWTQLWLKAKGGLHTRDRVFALFPNFPEYPYAQVDTLPNE